VNKRILIIGGLGVLLVIAVLVLIPKNKKEKVDTSAQTQVPAPKVTTAQLYQQALALNNSGDLLQARQLYKQIVTEHSDFENIASVQKELESLNMRLIFSNTPTEKSVIHEVQAGDTLGKIAKKYGTTIDLLKASNNLQSDIIRVGQKLRAWTGQFNIFVDKSQNTLMLKDGDEVVKVYRVSTGSNNSTPVGTYKITSKLVDPVWFNKGIVLPPESPQNVLGTRWLGFDLPGYGIHGTIEPETIGQQITAGCVRMKNEDVEELYRLIPLGVDVVIVN